MLSRLVHLAVAAATLAGTAVLPASANTWNVFPWSSQYLIGEIDLAALDCNDLWHARNEIYDRNGFIFVSARARAAFGTDGWTRNVHLNSVEQKNVANIQYFERLHYCG